MATDMGGFAQVGGPVIRDRFGKFLYSQRDDFTATGGETTILLSVQPLPNTVRVFKNGSLLKMSQYTLASITITLSTALTAGDVISIDYLSVYGTSKSILVPSPSDPLFAYVKALLHFEGTNGSTTFTDVIGNTWTSSTSGAAVIDTSLHAFGSASGNFYEPAYLNLNITTPDASALRIGTQDFCIEFQVNHVTTTPNQTAFSKGYVGAGDITLQSDGSSNNRWILYIGGSAVAAESTGTYATGVWYLIRVRRSGSVVTVERDGTVVASGTSSTNINNSTDPWCLGAAAAHSRSNSLYGHIDEFRLTIGNARAANVVQTAPWPDHA